MDERPTLVLTGASAGIGLAALEALAKEAFVIAVSRTSPPLAAANGHWLQGDLRAPERIATLIQQTLHERGAGLDGIIHCAATYGAARRHEFAETRDEEWDEIMMVNVRSQFILTQRLLPLLLARPHAFVVALSSDVATRAAPGRIAYGCSKAASHALFCGLAQELATSSVSVIQMLPAKQVLTRGIRARRPFDFDFTGYSSPDIFAAPIRFIVRGRGAGMNGQQLLVS